MRHRAGRHREQGRIIELAIRSVPRAAVLRALRLRTDTCIRHGVPNLARRTIALVARERRGSELRWVHHRARLHRGILARIWHRTSRRRHHIRRRLAIGSIPGAAVLRALRLRTDARIAIPDLAARTVLVLILLWRRHGLRLGHLSTRAIGTIPSPAILQTHRLRIHASRRARDLAARTI